MKRLLLPLLLILNFAVGQEVDLVTRWKHFASLSVEVAIATFLPGTAMKTLIGGNDPAVWVYFSPRINS